MGNPTETKEKPERNRCVPCPPTEVAVNDFNKKYPNLHVDYILIPCDGSVVTGDGDIGCLNHVNVAGHQKTAKFLIPKIGELMNWNY